MTNAVLAPRDRSVAEADIEGIGERTAERLQAVGVESVGQLADADVGRLADALADGFPRLKPETLQRRVATWISLAADVVGAAASRPTRGHVFLLTLWVDADGVPVRSRVGYRSTDEPMSEETSIETAGWSPLAFARFVEQAAGLEQARGLSEERVEQTEVVEWSRHRVEGQLVRRGSTAPIRADISTDGLEDERGAVRWRASGRLVPLGGGPHIALGSNVGTATVGEPIRLDFGSPPASDTVHRVWFDLAISPAADEGLVPRVASGEAAAAS